MSVVYFGSTRPFSTRLHVAVVRPVFSNTKEFKDLLCETLNSFIFLPRLFIDCLFVFSDEFFIRRCIYVMLLVNFN